VSSIQSLEVTLDQKLSFDQPINNTSKWCYHHIRLLRHIRESLLDEIVMTIACSVIGSRLDYCNPFLTGTSKSNFFNKLQRVQNTLARVVLRQRRCEHVMPALLKTTLATGAILCRIQNCIFSFLNKKNTGQPAYLRDLMPDYEPVRTLRSSSKHLIFKISVSTALTSRGFKHSAALQFGTVYLTTFMMLKLVISLNVDLKLIFSK